MGPAVSPAPPPGYTGNPDVDQTVTGGVNDQNFFRIEGPGIGTGTGNSYVNFACPGNSNCIQTDIIFTYGKNRYQQWARYTTSNL